MLALIFGAVAVAVLAGIWLNRNVGHRRRKRSHRIDLFARQREREAGDRDDGAQS